jgi:hypothetical protein
MEGTLRLLVAMRPSGSPAGGRSRSVADGRGSRYAVMVRAEGELAIVLHTHMPYVETWQT